MEPKETKTGRTGQGNASGRSSPGSKLKTEASAKKASGAKLKSEKTAQANLGADMSKYLDTGNEARITAAYANRDPRLQATVIAPYST